MAKCAFLGLGVMGYPMAGHLANAGHAVTIWNRTRSTADKWHEEYEGLTADSIANAVREADFVAICVGDDADVYEVVGEALSVIRSGTIIIDHTTASAECARKCYTDAKARDIGFVDAPISGGEIGAKNGQLTIMCGGDQADYDAALPIMGAYAKATTLMGDSGAGQMTKMINQICIAGLLQGLAEGVHFAQKAGLKMEKVLEAIGKGAAQSWQMDNRAVTMDEGMFEFGFAVDWMRKDLGIALRTADQIGAKLTMTRLVDGYYEEIQAMGGNRWDTSSLVARLT
ncbi:MAG: NAD(P)-dependent oxidoreductase [Hellea sp.]|nr:NAD(P)-dependent oxidoreductase [Hellea sp.]